MKSVECLPVGASTIRTAFIRWRLGDAGRFRSDILRGEGAACSRCTTASERKVEVSNPHGRTVSLFSKQGAPSQRGMPSGAEGQRIERWRGCPRPSLSKRAPFLSVNPPVQQVGIVPRATPTAPPARHPEPTRGPQRSGAALFPRSCGGVASSTGLEPVASAFGRQCSLPSELRRDGTPARTRTRNWRFVVSCDHPFSPPGFGATDGFRSRCLRRDKTALSRLSYCGTMRR